MEGRGVWHVWGKGARFRKFVGGWGARGEIGINLNPKKLKLIEVKETPYLSNIFHAIHFFYAITIDENEKIIINHESDEGRWFDLDDLPKRMLDKKEDIIMILNKARLCVN